MAQQHNPQTPQAQPNQQQENRPGQQPQQPGQQPQHRPGQQPQQQPGQPGQPRDEKSRQDTVRNPSEAEREQRPRRDGEEGGQRR